MNEIEPGDAGVLFVGGSRKVSRLHPLVRDLLDAAIDAGETVVVGDANGADKAVQAFFADKHYANVIVFHSGDRWRNRLAPWETRAVASGERGFRFYTAKDRAMAHEATRGLMIWDGESKGTLLNAVRLLGAGKAATIFRSPDKAIVELSDHDDWRRFSRDLPAELVETVESEYDLETKNDAGTRQASLF
ncbi:MAG: hypothetical protein H6684_15485 [Deltaproteobacteria bacterium]|nr:hypothetical protein [bacterium]MCB9475730.1 hypothetical protein [Deltaproteobacteria bacterium]MCB9479252.1 hypothetical protein [Deltaproteobacteria bacterium]MCB9490132.1 hypothetical protein [Deltaproteobacteria bacterium]